ncbi:YlmC/YmxH family sporulation protein [Paludifilum halophilum]|nr:YlmC/YmxH family sporulation protein [Paludifilum halophilum]
MIGGDPLRFLQEIGEDHTGPGTKLGFIRQALGKNHMGGWNMRWSEFADKELIDVDGGEKIGTAGQADLVIDDRTGKIRSMLLPVGSSWFGKKQGEIEISWHQIRKVGPEMVIVESSGKGRLYQK